MRSAVFALVFLALLFFSSGYAVCQKISMSSYIVRYEEKVSADYTHLLDSGATRNFKDYLNYYRLRLETGRVNDSLLLMSLSTDSIYIAGGNEQPEQTKVTFLFKHNDSDPLQNCLYLQGAISSFMFVCIRNIVSNILFYYPSFSDSVFRSEPFIDGIYSVRYSDKQELPGIIKLKKEKIVDYKPGIVLFRNVIDSFSSGLLFDRKTGILLNANMYERKRQKMGRRNLADVITRIKVESVPQTGVTGDKPKIISKDYPLQVAVYRQLSYLERMQRTARARKSNPTLQQLLQEWNTITPENTNTITTGMRNSLVLGIISPVDVKALMDSLPVNSAKFGMLEDALLEAGTPGSQDVIALLLQRANEPELYYKRLMIKIGVTAPLLSSKLLNRMFAIKMNKAEESLSAVTGLALANNACLLQEERMPVERKRITNFLYKCFKDSPKSREYTVQWLKEAGNAGDETVLSILPQVFELNDTDLHKEVMYSLRFIAGSAVDSILAGQLSDDVAGDYAIFLADIFRLRYPAPVIRTAIYRYLKNNKQKSEEATKTFIDYLSEWKDDIKETNAGMRSFSGGM